MVLEADQAGEATPAQITVMRYERLGGSILRSHESRLVPWAQDTLLASTHATRRVAALSIWSISVENSGSKKAYRAHKHMSCVCRWTEVARA